MAVPHLTLTFLDSGLALDKADGEPVWDSGWDGLEEMSPVERSVLPDGRAGVVIVVRRTVTVERRHRFVLGNRRRRSARRPQSEPAPRRTGCAPGRPGRAVSRLLMVGDRALAALATMTALLLSAAHVIHF